MGTIIYYIIVGLIVGALGRLFLKGNQNIGMLWTIVLGILGAVIGGWITENILGNQNANGGIPWVALIVSVLVAMGLIAAYIAITNRSNRV